MSSGRIQNAANAYSQPKRDDRGYGGIPWQMSHLAWLR